MSADSGKVCSNCERTSPNVNKCSYCGHHFFRWSDVVFGLVALALLGAAFFVRPTIDSGFWRMVVTVGRWLLGGVGVILLLILIAVAIDMLFSSSISEMKQKKNVAGLVKLLDHEDGGMCQAAAEVLDSLDWQSIAPSEAAATYWARNEQWDKCVEMGALAVKPLSATLDTKSQNRAKPFARSHAAAALRQIGDRRAVPAFITLLKETCSLEVGWIELEGLQCLAVQALGEMGDSRAVEPLIAFIRGKNYRGSSFLLAETARALGKLGDKRAIEVLVEAYNHKFYDENEWEDDKQIDRVRQAVNEALEAISGEDSDTFWRTRRKA